MQYSKNIEVKVGLMVIVSLVVLFLGLALLSRWQFATQGFHIHVQFNFLNHLSVGAPVRVAGGLDVGFVKNIYQKGMETYVLIYVDNRLTNLLPKREETQFAIFTQGLMGQKYINIHIPEHKEGDIFYKDGDITRGIDPPSIDHMLLMFSSWFDGKNGGQVLAEIIHETKLFIEGLNMIVSENRRDIRSTVKNTKELLGSTIVQFRNLAIKLNSLSTNLLDISDKNKADVQIMLQNLSLISNDLNEISKRITSGKGSMGKLLYDDKLYQDLVRAASNAEKLFSKLGQNPWRLIYKD